MSISKSATASLLFGILYLIQGAAQVQAPGYGELDFEPPAAGSYRLPPLGKAADAQVLTTNHQTASLHQLFGSDVTLLSFIYTRCNDANGCPLATHVLLRTLMQLKQHPELVGKLRVISLSFDPAGDTPEILQAYSQGFSKSFPNWRFVTTASEAAIAPILSAYGQSRIFELDEKGQRSGVFAHTLRVFLIDREQRIRNIYSPSFLHPDVLVNDVTTVLLDDDPSLTQRSSVAAESGADDLAVTDPSVPLGLPPLPVPADNPQSAAKIALGEQLFFDRRLSLNNTLSCAMCHIPAQGFANHELETAVGFEGRTVRRNAPTIYNVAYLETLFHDGRESTLEQQVWQPLLASNEMANPSIGRVLDKIRAIADYDNRFESIFARGPSMETVGQALASYQRSLLLANSAFDRWHYGGEAGALSAEAQAGFALFSGRAGCADCHRIGKDYALFTDQLFHNTGIGWYQSMRPNPPTHRVQLAPGVFADVKSEIIDSASEPPPNDLGRYEVTQDPAERWRYRTPSLRNVALTAPYMHNGSLATLSEVIAYYNRGGYAHEQLDPRIRPLGLSDSEQRQLLAFLQALTGDQASLEQHLSRADQVPIGDISKTDPHYANEQ